MSINKTVASLAVCGGQPAFASPLHVGRPNIGDRVSLLKRIETILDRYWLTNDGPMVREFEQRIAAYLGVRNCVAVSNATLGIQLTVRALGLTGEIIVPAFTFVATAHALLWEGAKPVFCDVGSAKHSIDPDSVRRAISTKTTAIVGVHLWGEPCAAEELEVIAKDNGLILLFDAAHAFGCSYRGRMIGTRGRAEVFSFHATKFLNTFEGGAVVTDDDALAARLRLMRNFGFAGYDRVESIGINAKMSEPCAAMGLTGMDIIDEVIAVNHSNYDRYATALSGIPGVRLFQYNGSEKRNYQYVIVEVDQSQAGLSRDELASVLHAENVLARRYFHPGCHRMEPYRSDPSTVRVTLVNSERLAGSAIAFPTGTAVSHAEIDSVSEIVRVAVANADLVRGCLPRGAP